MRFPAVAVLGCSVVFLLGGCGQTPPAPGDIVQSYEAALAEGNYTSACGYLDPHARAALARKVGPRATCAQGVARCLPYTATNPKKDQSQLFYANVLATEHGPHAVVRLNGNPVANAIRKVTLSNERSGWTLTSWGEGFNGCQARRHHRAR